MCRIIILFLSIFSAQTFYAQGVSCSAENREAFHDKLTELKKLDATSNGSLMVAIGKSFLGIPYVAQTLEIGPRETLVIDLLELDCTTFVENVLAFSIMKKSGAESFDDYTDILKNIRYLNGQINGYSSRLHYFSDWIAKNQSKGLVRDVTQELGGTVIDKDRNFMSTHRELYPFLKDDTNYKQILEVEKNLAEIPFFVLSQEDIKLKEDSLKEGDIIALATAIPGLDVTHTGVAMRGKDDRIHLLHASSSGQVEISQLPLVEYLKKIKSNTGVLVARPTF